MWKGMGRSGIGDQTIIGEYDDWNGLSMNGRQWKNRHTMETRDLSGADYWHQRKALEPKMAEDIPTFVHGRANVSAFAEAVSKPKAVAKKKTAFEKICTADKTYEKLCHLSETLDSELDSKQISWDDYIYARKQLDKKLERQWQAVCKLRGWTNEGAPVQPHSLDFTLDAEAPRQLKIDRQINFGIIPSDSVFHSLKDDNLFKIGYSICLTAVNKVSKLWNVSKQIIQEGVI